MVDINLPNAKPIGSVDLKTVTKITPVINENYEFTSRKILSSWKRKVVHGCLVSLMRKLW